MSYLKCDHCNGLFNTDDFPEGISPLLSEGRNYCAICYPQETYIDAAQPVNPYRWRRKNV